METLGRQWHQSEEGRARCRSWNLGAVQNHVPSRRSSRHPNNSSLDVPRVRSREPDTIRGSYRVIKVCVQPSVYNCRYLWRRREGFLIIASGMAAHSFASIAEIGQATTDEERASTRDKVIRETRTFDKHIRNALAIQNSAKRREALLNLEQLFEFKRSHPTVEVTSLLQQ